MPSFSLQAWASRHGVSPAALAELRAGLGAPIVASVPAAGAGSESGAQQAIRLAAPGRDVLTFRNNVGALLDKRGVPVRYGLANDSKTLNKHVKSADLIGIKRRLVTLEMVGTTIGQFWCREVKRPGWTYGGDEHEQAQLRWATLISAHGGDAGFATGPNEI